MPGEMKRMEAFVIDIALAEGKRRRGPPADRPKPARSSLMPVMIRWKQQGALLRCLCSHLIKNVRVLVGHFVVASAKMRLYTVIQN
jgi:hypothetical protein